MNKKETEDKVAYLLQQLRSAEMKINRMETLAARGESKQRLSFLEDGPSQTSPTAASANAAVTKDVAKMSDKKLSTSILSTHSPRDQPDGASSPLSDSASPRATSGNAVKDFPMAKVAAEVTKPAAGMAGDRNSLNKYAAFVSGTTPLKDEGAPKEVQVEVVRRWENEKERRGQMERKNSDLSAELRLLKSQMKSSAP